MSSLQELLERGDRDGARAAATDRIRATPTDAEALATLARLELEAGALDAAKGHLARVLAKDRQRYDVQLSEAVLLQLTNQPDAARLAFAQLTGTFPDRPEAYFSLGVSLLDKQDAKGAERALATAVKLAPKHFFYRFRFAEAAAQAGHFEQASDALLTCIELKPDFNVAYTALARMLEAGGEGEKALELVELGLGALPGDARLLAERARLLFTAGDSARAMESAKTLDGGGLALAEQLMRMNAHDAALAVCDELDARGQGSAKVSLVRGLTHENAGHLDEALEAYAKSMTQDPSDWAAANNRGLLRLERARDDEGQLTQAQADFEEAIRRAKGAAAEPMLNLALLHGHRKDFAAGVALAKKVAALPAAGELKAQAEKLIASLEKASKQA